MSERDWYFHGGDRPGDLLARSFEHDTTMYREVAEHKEQEGTDEAILAGVVLLEVADAVDQWFVDNTDMPFGNATLLLDHDESNVVADAEHEWFGIPGNRQRQEIKWHEEYLTRLGAGITSLLEAGYVAEGAANRREMEFRLRATHRNLVGDSGIEKVIKAIQYKGKFSDFLWGASKSGLITLHYDTCPPSGRFEPVIKQLAEIV